MQEEVEKQACNLVVTVAKLTVQELMKKLNEYVAEKKADKTNKMNKNINRILGSICFLS